MNGHHKNTNGTLSSRLIVGPQLTRSMSSSGRIDSERVIAATGAPRYESFTSPRHADVPKIPPSPRWSDAPPSQFGNGCSNGWRGSHPPRTGPTGPGPSSGGGWPPGDQPPPPDIVGGEAWGKGAGNDAGSSGTSFSGDRQRSGSWPLAEKVDNPDIPNISLAPALTDRLPSPGAWHPAPDVHQTSNGHPNSNGYPSVNGTRPGSLDFPRGRGGSPSWGVEYPDSGPRMDASAHSQNGPRVPLSLSLPFSDFPRHSNGHDTIGPPENGSQGGSGANGWTKGSPGEYRQVATHPTSSTDGADSGGAHVSGAPSDLHSHAQRGGPARPHSPPTTPGKAANGHRSPAPIRMGPMIDNADWPSFRGVAQERGMRSSRSVDTALAASGTPLYRGEKSMPVVGEPPVVELGGALPRRSLTSAATDMASLRGAVAALQATVESVALQVQQLAHTQQVMLAQNTIPAPGGVAGGEELPNMVGKLVEGVAGGMAELAALIRAKDQQQQCRLFNLASAFEHDELIPPPNDQGKAPLHFPPTRQDFAMLTPERTEELVGHFGLPMAPEHDRLDRLGRFVGLRFS